MTSSRNCIICNTKKRLRFFEVKESHGCEPGIGTSFIGEPPWFEFHQIALCTECKNDPKILEKIQTWINKVRENRKK